jgi:hypothetical protein
MQRGWQVSLGMALTVLVAAMGVSAFRGTPPPSSDELHAEADPCFRYGRFECCMRPDEE